MLAKYTKYMEEESYMIVLENKVHIAAVNVGIILFCSVVTLCIFAWYGNVE